MDTVGDNASYLSGIGEAEESTEPNVAIGDFDFNELPVSSESTPEVDLTEMAVLRDQDKDDRKYDTSDDIRVRGQVKAEANAQKRSTGQPVEQKPEDNVSGDPYRRTQEVEYTKNAGVQRLNESAIKSDQEHIAAQRSGSDVGARIWGKILSDERLRFNEIGVGIGEIQAVYEQNPTYLDKLLVNLFPDGASNHDLSKVIDSINRVADKHDGSEVHVGVNKPPDTDISDQQDMVLRVFKDRSRGIFMQPIISAMFTADYDGDDANISLDPVVPGMLRSTIDLLVHPDGTTHLKPEWFTTERIADGMDENGMTRKQFVTDVMFDGIAVNDAIIQKVLALGDNIDPKAKNRLLVYLMLEIRKFVGTDNYRFEQILHAVYNTFQSVRRYVVASQIDSQFVDAPVEPRNEGDRAILNFVDDIVIGRIPANWFDFKKAFNSFVGDVRSGNSDFRVSASVGKKFKLDNRILVGGEYVIDLGNEKQVETFLQCTFEYAMAERMSHEFKRNGRSYSYSKELKAKVIQKVGFSDSTVRLEDGSLVPRYANTVEWINEFIRVYSREAAIINEANLVVKSNMQISQMSNRNVVATISRSGRRGRYTYKDVVDALVEVYDTTSMNRMFRNLYWNDRDPKGWGREMVENARGYRDDDSDTSRKGWVANTKYKSYSIRRFSKDNHMVTRGDVQRAYQSCEMPVLEDVVDRKTGQRVYRWRTESVKKDKDGRIVKDDKGNVVTEIRYFDNITDGIANRFESNLMLAIADQKTSSESAYATRVYGHVDRNHRVSPGFKHDRSYQNYQRQVNEDTSKYKSVSKNEHKTLMQMRFELLQDIKKLRERGGDGKYLAMEDVVRVILASGPEMFSYFGMDSMNGWENSKIARAMENAKDVNELGGINMTMHYAMRTNPIFAYNKTLKKFRSIHGMAELEAQTRNEIAFMEQELASSSQTWQAIVMEMKTGEAWEELPKRYRSLVEEADGGSRTALNQLNMIEADWYWAKPRHATIDEMMRDSRIGFVEKRNILCDVVRMHTGDATFKSYEVCYQLEVGSAGEWSLKSDGQKQLFETYNNMERMFNQYGDVSFENMVNNIEDAYKEYGDKPGSLMGTIHNLALHPGTMCKIGFDMMADSVCSVMDRLYDQTEKSKTHPWSNEAYQGISLQRNGGYTNEIFRTDDLIVGSQNIRQVTAYDLIRVLDDPKFKLTGYNDIGEVVQVDRASLLGFADGDDYDVESEVWRFLRDNPRIAGCLRMQTIAVSATMDAKAYVVAACDTTETMNRCFGDGTARHNPMDDVSYLMFDHPGFHAIASLATPAVGSKASNRSPKIAAVEKYMCWLIYKNSTDDRWSAEERADDVLATLGVTRKVLEECLMSDYDREILEMQRDGMAGIEDLGGAREERERQVDEMYNNCHTFIVNYLLEVGKDQSVDHKAKMRTIERPDIKVDSSSVHSFYDVIQELSGAKTQVSTGIEGYETFQFAEWAQLISSKDRYATLNAIIRELADDPELAMTFDGALTNGGILRIPNGDIRQSNIRELRAAIASDSDHKGDDLVVLCPESYEVKDRMIDSQGRTISTQRSYMMMKRALGAEGHNLQVMKTGIDGLDTISKVKGRYYRDSDGNIVSYDMRTQIIRDAAEKWASQQSGLTPEQLSDGMLFQAKLELARELLRSNNEIGYNEDTLSNYMCLADLMVIMGDDGKIYVRSLAQIYTALKYRIGVNGSAMSSDQRKKLAMEIVNDRSEFAIGRAVGGPSEAFDRLRPSRVSPSSRGVYPYLSNLTVNKRLLEQISEEQGVEPWDESMRRDQERRIRKNHKWLNKVLKDIFVLRQYHVTACIDLRSWEENHDIGMSGLVVIGEDMFSDQSPYTNRQITNILLNSWNYGNTVLVPAIAVERNSINWKFAGDLMPVATDEEGNPSWYMINTFNMRLNGAEASPYKAAYAQNVCPYEKDMFTVEDSYGEFDYGDSGGKITKHMLDRTSISHQPVSVDITAHELFAQQYRMLEMNRRYNNGHYSIDVSFADQVLLDEALKGGIKMEIDYGVPKGSKDFQRRKKDVDRAIERYREAVDDGDGKVMMQDMKAGDIVAWALARITEEGKPSRYVFAPIIPRELHGVKRGMDTFQCISCQYKNGDHSVFTLDLQNSAPFDGYAKAFLPSGGADKVMIDLSRPIDGAPRTLKDGTQIDIYVDSRTTSSRRIGTLNRLRTMETMIRVARRNGYNFANAKGAFPDAATNPMIANLKEDLLHYPTVKKEVWDRLVNTVRFHEDPQIDAFVRFNCRKCLRDGGNPSHFLASEFIDPRISPDQPVNSMFQWEYIPSFENSLNYEDAFLKFFALLNPKGEYDGLKFCPNGINDNSSDCLFRLKQDENGILAEDYDRGVLQMQVPHRYVDLKGREGWIYVWESVFAGNGFFGEDFSSGSRPNIEGASRMNDMMNTIGYIDAKVSETESRLKYDWATADLGDLAMTGNVVTPWE